MSGSEKKSDTRSSSRVCRTNSEGRSGSSFSRSTTPKRCILKVCIKSCLSFRTPRLRTRFKKMLIGQCLSYNCGERTTKAETTSFTTCSKRTPTMTMRLGTSKVSTISLDSCSSTSQTRRKCSGVCTNFCKGATGGTYTRPTSQE